MEISQDLKNLYRHWEKHSGGTLVGESNWVFAEIDVDLLNEVEHFITARMLIWERKQAGLAAPWSDDQVLANYRFCNIYRELDKQTWQFHRMLLDLRDNFDLWLLNMFFCRMICRPETVGKVGLLSFDQKNNQAVYERLMALERPKFGNAYVFPVSTIMRGKYPTREKFLCFYLPEIMPKVAAIIQGFQNITVVEGVQKILPFFGYNLEFLWTEVLIDVAYQYPDLINLFGRFPIGPGSKPTMLRFAQKIVNKMERPVAAEEICLILASQKLSKFPYLTWQGRPIWLSAENWEGIGCEFRKYTNLKAGGGRKRKYLSMPKSKF